MGEQRSVCTDESYFDERAWKKTLTASTIAQFISMTGFSFVMPFLPDYIRQMGIEDVGKQMVWAGYCGAAPAWTMFIFAPIWGSMADRIGRKVMVMRAMFGAAVIISLMGLAWSPSMLLILRLLQGVVTGTVSATNALVSGVTPPKKASFTLGIMQAAVHAGHLIGPLLGGYSADMLGFKVTFVIAGAMLLIGGLMVLFFTKEGPLAPSINSDKGVKCEDSLLSVLKVSGFLVLIGIVFIGNFSRMVLSPVFLPYVRSLITDHSMDKTITGGLLSTTAALTMVTSVLAGRLSDKYGPKMFLVTGTIFAGIFCMPQAFVSKISEYMPALGALFVLRVLIGIGMGMIAPATGGLVNRIVPRTSQGKAFGLVQSATSLGMGIAPMAGGHMAGYFGFPVSFVVTGLIQIAVGVTAWFALRKVKIAGERGGGRNAVGTEEREASAG